MVHFVVGNDTHRFIIVVAARVEDIVAGFYLPRALKTDDRNSGLFLFDRHQDLGA